MKILHVINSLGVGGAEKLITFLLPSLKENHAVDVELLVLTRGNDYLNSVLTSKGITVVCLNSKNIYSPVNTLKISQFIKKGNYDIIHAHLFPTQYWITLGLILIKKRPKLIFTEHNTSNKRITSKLLSAIDKRMYLKIDILVCITSEIAQLYSVYQPKIKNRISIIHNGVPIHDITNAKPILRSEIDPNITPEDKLILQVSAFRPQKDQKTVIKALLHLPSNFKVLFAGNGERMDDCISLAKKIGVDKRVIFLGNRNDVFSIQKSVDYIVLSTHYEGLSLACIEGMASGKPFIAANVKGVYSLVDNAGLLFEKSNETDLASKIMDVENSNELREKIVARCMKRASEYSIEHMAKEHALLYKRIIEDHES